MDADDFELRDSYDILGEQVLGEMAQSVGFDWGGLLKGGAAAGATALDQKAADDAKKQAGADAQKVIELDATWANAEANLELAGSDPTARAAAQVVRDQAAKDSASAGAKLNSDGNDKRCKAANDALRLVATAAQGAPGDKAKQAKMHAWQKVVSACGGGSSSSDDDKGGKRKKSDEGNWFTDTHSGLPGWGWGLVAIGGLTLVGLLIRAYMHRKKH